MARREVTVEALRGLGEIPLGESDWLIVDRERVIGFADATEDHQMNHFDPERAAQGQFGTTIAHGYVTRSLARACLRNFWW